MKSKKTIYLAFFILFLLIQIISCKRESDDLQEDLPSPIVFNSNLTYGTITDIEGNVYKTIEIGDYTWMAENLRTTKYNDGTDIPEVEGYDDWRLSADSAPAFCWYNTLITNKDIYGALYNGYAVNTGKLAPAGWHVATTDEWTNLLEICGGNRYAGYKLKEIGTTHWLSADDRTINSSGFTALPGGVRGNPLFGNLGKLGVWWSSTADGTSDSNGTFQLEERYGVVYISNNTCHSGFSVRCVRDH